MTPATDGISLPAQESGVSEPNKKEKKNPKKTLSGIKVDQLASFLT